MNDLCQLVCRPRSDAAMQAEVREVMLPEIFVWYSDKG
jgi:hypothetical protein